MIEILLGSDDFSKKQYIQDKVASDGAEVEYWNELESGVNLQRLTEQNLFAKAKIFILEELLFKIDFEDVWKKLEKTANLVIFIEESLDKRTILAKKITANQNIKFQEFLLPHGRDLNTWIISHVKNLGGKITPSAVETLAMALGRDDTKQIKVGGKVTSTEEIYSLWQADSEIKKLVAYAEGREITPADVEHLVNGNSETDILEIVNSLAEKDFTKTTGLVSQFLLSSDGGDEKSKIIQLNALLSEQFRNIFVIQELLQQKLKDGQILKQTAWSSGRLFILKKLAKNFVTSQVKDVLNKLELLDTELKTTATPAAVLLDLILFSLLAKA